MWRAAPRSKGFSPSRPTACRRSRLPGNDDDGRTLQAGLDQGKLRTDMLNSARFLKSHKSSNGKLGVTGFCWGGGTTNFLAVALGADLHAGAPFYGAAAETAGVPKVKARC